MNVEKLGLGNSLPEDAAVVHSTVMGSNCLGRLTDLLSAWCKRELQLDPVFLSEFRLVLQGLLEFTCPKGEDALGQIELGEDGFALMVAARFPCRISLKREMVEKELTQYWLNSNEVKLLKKLLGAQDRVEVRYNETMNLIEWRVCRPKQVLAESDVDYSSFFRVYVDHNAGLDTSKVKYKDLGDLPFDEWLNDSYRNKPNTSRAGKILVEGESQDEQEWARVVVERERQKIEDEIQKIAELEKVAEQELVRKFSSNNETLDNTLIEFESKTVPTAEIEQILASHQDRVEASKELGRRIRNLEISLDQEKTISHQRMVHVETLLRKKEYLNQRHLVEINELQKVISESRKKKEFDRNENNFRMKALEMFEVLKKSKEDYKELLKLHDELKNRESSNGDSLSAAPGAIKAAEELTKKLERGQRALDAEKVKVKNLSERVITAEREAQFTAPLVEDLESKVEHTLKVVQQHKKETEQVKQKLVQSEAEKNRIKNDLLKANAQIQTLMKRQAS